MGHDAAAARTRRSGSRPTAATPGPTSRANPGLAARRARADRRRRLARRRPPRLGARRGRGRRALPLGRRRRDLAARAARSPSCAGAPGTTCTSSPTRPTPTPSGSRTTRCGSRSTAARRSCEVATPHGDNHDLWIDPAEPAADDRGQRRRRAASSFNGGAVVVDDLQPADRAVLPRVRRRPAARTGSTARSRTTGRSACRASRTAGAITAIDWVQPGGGESGYIAVKPGDPEHRRRRRRRQRARHGPAHPLRPPHGAGAHRSASGPRRTAWARRRRAPLPLPVDLPGLLLALGPARAVDRRQPRLPLDRRGADAGRSSAPTSRATTRRSSGRRAARSRSDNTGAEVYCTIFALAESPHERDVLWAGTDDGLVHLSRDRGRTWQPVTPPELPEWALISVIEPSPHDAATCYVAATRYKLDDTRPYLFKTSDYGRTWTRITRRHAGRRVHARRSARTRAGAGCSTAGTETGVWVSLDDGGAWQRLRGEPAGGADPRPRSSRTRDLVVATHGRSFWILDDLTPLHQMAEAIADADAHLFAPRPTVRWRAYRGHGMKPGPEPRGRVPAGRLARLRLSPGRVRRPARSRKRPLDAGENPPNGVIVHYWLQGGAGGRHHARLPRRRRPRDPLVHEPPPDAAREAVAAGSAPARRRRRAASRRTRAEPGDDEPRPTKDAGANRFVWNLRGPDATKLPDNKGRGGTLEMLAGPRVPPGAYQVRLTVDGADADAAVRDREGPARRRRPDADLREQYAWAKKAHDLLDPRARRGADACATCAPRRRRGRAAWQSPARQGRRAGARPHADADRGAS